ncbi:MAG: putative ABC exporter domain-containing protein [Sulfobacillus sp.]
MTENGRPANSWDALVALCYLDWTGLRNRLRLLVGQPKRLVPWLLFAGFLSLIVFAQHASGTRHGGFPFTAIGSFLAPLLPGVYLGACGWVVLAATRRAPASLSVPADAHFLLLGPLPPRIVVLWLQLRQMVSLVKGLAINAVLWSAYLAASAVTPGSVVKAMLAVMLAIVLLYGVRLPAFVASRTYARLPIQVMAVLAMAAAFGLVARAAASQLGLAEFLALPSTAAFSQVPLGSMVLAAVVGQVAATWWLALLATLSLVLTTAVSVDCVPEVWTSSAQMFRARSRLVRGRSSSPVARDPAVEQRGAPSRRATSSSGRAVPRGAGTIWWKEWMVFTRSRTGIALAVLFVVLAAVIGAVVGRLSGNSQGGALGALTGVAIWPAIILSSASGIRLAEDLRRPLWWLSAGSLQARLAAWAAASSLRLSIPLLVALLAGALAANLMTAVLWAVPLVLIGVWLLRVIGLAVYVMIPGRSDMRGPGNLLRMLGTLVLLVPVAAIGGVLGGVLGSPPIALMAAALTAAAEALLLIAFAASRLAGNGLAMAQAEGR